MKTKNLAVAICTVLALAACSIGKPVPPATMYILEPAPPAAVAGARRPEMLRMGIVTVAAPFASSALVYRVDDVRYITDPYEMFITEPAGMLGSRIADWLDRAGPFKSVAQPGSAQPAAYVLEATVTELYGDFRASAAPAAVISIQFALVDLSGARSKQVFDRTIGRRAEIATASPEALVRGYGQALSEILAELSTGLQATTK